MKITLTTDDGSEPATLPYDGAAFVNIESKCPTCGQQSVGGTGNSIENHDTYRADAVCTEVRHQPGRAAGEGVDHLRDRRGRARPERALPGVLT